MARMSLKEAIHILEQRGYSVTKELVGYVIRGNDGSVDIGDGYKVVRIAKTYTLDPPTLPKEKSYIEMLDELYSILRECHREISDLGISVAPLGAISLMINNAKSSWGYCSRRGTRFTIKISRMTIDLGLGAVRNTMIHELLHTVPNCMNHGAEWKRIAKMVDEAYGYTTSRIISREALVSSANKRTTH